VCVREREREREMKCDERDPTEWRIDVIGQVLAGEDFWRDVKHRSGHGQWKGLPSLEHLSLSLQGIISGNKLGKVKWLISGSCHQLL
jgi:hypothetical protein